ncbi:IS66 family insertion sequence element accessory protein TnpA [Oribacterium sp. FC2011]|uniref:IS66 family insertion sequence element accessory protein TnpA n=1 Tax=Oribacterium sp. FC2011 TaxID=1408311 RepID=UPI0006790DC4|nr:hypothetical protein [Oribacterium sp. FC2011]
MDLITHEVRSKHWGEIIAQCQAKPEGVSTKQWLRENGIKEKAYYYWLRKFRKQAYEIIQTDNSTDCTAPVDGVSFYELPNVLQTEVPKKAKVAPDAVIDINDVRVELFNSASESLIRKILAGVHHASSMFIPPKIIICCTDVLLMQKRPLS